MSVFNIKVLGKSIEVTLMSLFHEEIDTKIFSKENQMSCNFNFVEILIQKFTVSSGALN